LIGYARVPTIDLNPDLQIGALKAAGCERVLNERASERTVTGQSLPALWKSPIRRHPYHLARSLKQLI